MTTCDVIFKIILKMILKIKSYTNITNQYLIFGDMVTCKLCSLKLCFLRWVVIAFIPVYCEEYINRY